MTLTLLADESLEFPPLENALTEPDGLLAVGGDLSPERLEAAYRHGCFPWFNQDDPILWWSPDPRMVLFPEKLHVSRSMLKLLKKSPFEITFDKAFVEVIKACSEPRAYTDQTWITEAMQKAYITMHNKGLAHSVEVWAEGQLVGGLYGLSLGRLFFGESMFSRISNASKIGFIHLVYKLRDARVVLIDCQMHTSHLQSLGAELIARHEFADYLQSYQNQPITIDWHSSGIVI
ncbi:leucyl/phenylalanyl-tRNA--protein transferase [Entomomonas asaccharolytica]|uniref:Leucyl/phenylalanyl-tRNA--protein transferase n=1 Tax=Entomomonas asaccharolytica TaxID=2785331 RepID=A0A974NDA7_9GAMM|nr:leucyl/phenylalanyl-tRNA--protein transferase [Entomomonas asaccharolytica]QQP84630.1 leucyl/phenylalanyl-tRNA--protein transferase [Entomomonas asaccharolytica]